METEFYDVYFKVNWGDDLSNHLINNCFTGTEKEVIEWTNKIVSENPLLSFEVIRVFDSKAGYKPLTIADNKLVPTYY